MKRSSYGIKVTYNDKTEKVIDGVTIPVLRNSVETQRKMPNTSSAVGVMYTEFGEEFELSDDQICKLSLESFREPEVRKDYSSVPKRK